MPISNTDFVMIKTVSKIYSFIIFCCATENVKSNISRKKHTHKKKNINYRAYF